MDKEFEEWWADLEKSAPWMAQRGLDYAIKDIAYAAWKAGWDDGYDAPRWPAI